MKVESELTTPKYHKIKTKDHSKDDCDYGTELHRNKLLRQKRGDKPIFINWLNDFKFKKILVTVSHLSLINKPLMYRDLGEV